MVPRPWPSPPSADRPPVRRQERAEGDFALGRGELLAVLDTLPALIGYWDAAGRNRLANQAYEAFFGVAPEQMLGQHISEVLGPEFYEPAREQIEAALRGEAQLFDRALAAMDGSQWHLQVSYVPDLVDGEVRGFLVLAIDITERRQAELAATAAESRFRTLFESAPIGTYLVDRELRVVDANAVGATLLGRRRSDLIGRAVLDITHPDDRDDCREQYARLWSGEAETCRLEKRYLHADGHEIWTQVDMTLLREADGSASYALGQVQDISDRRQLQQELEYLADHDDLTGVLNRRGLQRELVRHTAEVRRYGAAGALLVLDLDNFKVVNDTLGHKAGDELIAAVAADMAARLRSSDVLARLGGDEFAVIVPRGSADDALAVGRSLVEVVRARPSWGGDGGSPLTLSVGVAAFDGMASAEEMLDRADSAMYDAKAAGRDAVACWSDPTSD